MKKTIKLIALVLVLSLVVVACKHGDKKDSKIIRINKAGDTITQTDTVKLSQLKNDYMTMAVLYQQKSGEWRALAYQAYTLAKVMLDKDLADKSINQHRCIVVDIDETVLDNSPYQAQCILTNTGYNSETWNEWCNKAIAKPVPGALEFLSYAKANGLDIYYVTNRKEDVRESTMKNLKDCGFPFVDEKHLLMSNGESGKEDRRQQVLQHNHISLLAGDNLNDFSDMFEKKSADERMSLADKVHKDFGKRFIVIPNAMYGDWEGAIYGYNWNASDSARNAMRIGALGTH